MTSKKKTASKKRLKKKTTPKGKLPQKEDDLNNKEDP